MSPLLLVPGPLKSAKVKGRLAGLGMLLVLLGLIALSILIYNKVFTSVEKVTLRADRAGNQLQSGGDVKIRGLIVGEIRNITSTGDGAEIELALDPEKTSLIPANVQARLIPKTLFGEKYVSLIVPEQPSEQSISEGDVIEQDRSETATETGQLFDNLLPLLEAVEPAKLNSFLSALATALNGRGERLGENLVLVDTYLRGLEPSYPELAENLRLLPEFTDVYADAAPDLLEFLDNISATNRTLVDQESQLNAFLTGTAEFSRTADVVLRENEERLISVPRNNLPFLRLAAQYSPSFPCFLDGMARLHPIIAETFGGNPGTDFKGLHIDLHLVEQREGYTQADLHRNLEDSGPSCLFLPDPPVPAPAIDFQDGYRDGQGQSRNEAIQQEEARTGRDDNRAAYFDRDTEGRVAPVGAGLSSGRAGTADEQAVVDALVAPVLGVPFDQVPDVATLLFGPAARGTAVSVSLPHADAEADAGPAGGER